MSKLGAIAITVGDPAGIGPEIVQSALFSGKLDPEFSYHPVGSFDNIAVAGHPTLDTAQQSWQQLEESVAGIRSGRFLGVVTGPVCKSALYRLGFPYPGQTEFYAARLASRNFGMLLTGGKLTVALVTLHIPLAQVATTLKSSEIVRVGQLLADFLRLRHGGHPRIAVAGLNPHAGEDGALGREDVDIIAPAVEELAFIEAGRAHFFGPLPPDSVFHEAVEGSYDGVVCMYHDQGLIPLKLHAFHTGVNYTLGLPVVRTSPDHGTAFGIAGQGVARSDSMIAALRLAAEMLRRQRR